MRSLVASSEYELRLSQGAKIIRDLKERARTTLPIFYMSPGCRVGQPVALHLFEPRYRILIRRAMEGNNMFVYAARTPKRGHRACLVKVTSALFHRDGRANIVGFGVEDFLMEDVWIEEGTAGLYYTRFVARQGGFNPSDGVGARRRAGAALTSRLRGIEVEEGTVVGGGGGGARARPVPCRSHIYVHMILRVGHALTLFFRPILIGSTPATDSAELRRPLSLMSQSQPDGSNTNRRT